MKNAKGEFTLANKMSSIINRLKYTFLDDVLFFPFNINI